MEAEYCFEHGIPYSEYLERWTPEDRSIVNAVSLEKASRCGLCGTADWEWEENPWAYQPVMQVCRGCMQKEVMRDSGDTLPKGAAIVLLPSATAERLAIKAAQDEAAGLSKRPIRKRNRHA